MLGTMKYDKELKMLKSSPLKLEVEGMIISGWLLLIGFTWPHTL